MFQTVNPTSNELIQEFASLTNHLLDLQLEQSQEHFYGYWKTQSLDQRIAAIQKLAKDLKENTESYAKLISLEMGKPIRQSLAEINKCVLLCNYYSESAPDFLKDQVIPTNANKSYVVYQPIGAVLGIMPWNFPFWQVCRFAVPALIAGNAVLLKPASNVPQCSLALEKAFSTAIGQPDVFKTLFIEEKQVAQVLDHPLVQGVALTGSERAGSAVGTLAGKAIKKCVLELGGSDAFVVLEDADIKNAAKKGAESRLNNSGQTCISAKRFIVVESVADRFIEALKEEMAAIKIGDPMHLETRLSVLARPDLVKNLKRQVEESIRLGAKVLLDGGPQAGLGNCFNPMILTNISPGMPAYHEELFGPVALVFRVPDEAAAVRQANDTIYGLGAAVWSENIARAEKVARQLDAGAIAINNLLHSDPKLPFGGVKRSGFGKELGKEGLLEFVNRKTISIN